MGVGRNAFSEVFMIPLSTAVSGGFTFTSNCRGFGLRRGDQMVATLEASSHMVIGSRCRSGGPELGHSSLWFLEQQSRNYGRSLAATGCSVQVGLGRQRCSCLCG